MGTLDKVKGLVENPPKEYRSAPFWGWNDRLQKENLGEQIEGFKKAGTADNLPTIFQLPDKSSIHFYFKMIFTVQKCICNLHFRREASQIAHIFSV